MICGLFNSLLKKLMYISTEASAASLLSTGSSASCGSLFLTSLALASNSVNSRSLLAPIRA
ncbi:hypothetical protein D3C71_2112870 [compost metagenome]